MSSAPVARELPAPRVGWEDGVVGPCGAAVGAAAAAGDEDDGGAAAADDGAAGGGILLLPIEVCDVIFAYLPLETLVHGTSVNRLFCKLTGKIIKTVRPTIESWRGEPFFVKFDSAIISITRLNLSRCRIGNAGLAEFADAITRLGSLVTLFLSSNTIGDDGIDAFSTALLKNTLPNLEVLWLFSNIISDRGIASLSNAIRSGALVSLECLHFCHNKVGDDGFTDLLRSLRKVSSMTSLRFEHNKIGDKGMNALLSAVISGSWQDLAIAGNLGNTEGVQKACRERRISCYA